jgi:hypothetical protein
MEYNTENYWVCGLRPSFGILKTREHDVSEKLCSLVFECWTMDSPKTQQFSVL